MFLLRGAQDGAWVGHMLGLGAAVGPFRMWENGGAPGACSQLHRLPGGRDPAQHSDSGRAPNPAPAGGCQAQSSLAEGPREPAQTPVKKCSEPQAAHSVQAAAGLGCAIGSWSRVGRWGTGASQGQKEKETQIRELGGSCQMGGRGRQSPPQNRRRLSSARREPGRWG